MTNPTLASLLDLKDHGIQAFLSLWKTTWKAPQIGLRLDQKTSEGESYKAMSVPMTFYSE